MTFTKISLNCALSCFDINHFSGFSHFNGVSDLYFLDETFFDGLVVIFQIGKSADELSVIILVAFGWEAVRLIISSGQIGCDHGCRKKTVIHIGLIVVIIFLVELGFIKVVILRLEFAFDFIRYLTFYLRAVSELCKQARC